MKKYSLKIIALFISFVLSVSVVYADNMSKAEKLLRKAKMTSIQEESYEYVNAARELYEEEYDKNPINMLSYMDATRIRYTHSNLKKEQETRSNIHIPSLKHSYRTYDKVVVIREGLEKEVQEHFEEIAPKCIKLVHNINDIENIIKNSEKELEFSDITFSNCEIEEINNILNNKKYIKLINIGRFSEEKGQVRLIKAFKDSYT